MTPLELAFPGLATGGYQLTSPPDQKYNCIAWAAGDPGNWWWPDAAGTDYWPAGVPREDTLPAFTAAYATLGFHLASSPDPADGLQKVALFAKGGKPTHAARLLPSGRWTSKLGSGHDIEHELAGLEGAVYGSVALVLERTSAEPAAS